MPIVSANSVFKNGAIAKVVGSDNQHFETSPSTLSSIWHSLKSYGSNVGHDFYDSAKNITQSIKDAGEGKQSVGSAGLQTAGEFAKSVFAPVTEAVKPVINKAADALSSNKTFQKFADTGLGNNISNDADFAKQKYDEWATQHPEASKNLEASINIGSLLAGEQPANKLFQGAKTGATTAVTTAKEAISGGVHTLQDAAEGSVSGVKSLANQASDLVTQIPENVKTELTKQSIPTETRMAKFDEYVSHAQNAVKDSAAPTPMEVAGQKAQSALKALDKKLQEAGQAKNSATEAVGKNPAGTVISDAIAHLENGVKDRFGGLFKKIKDPQTGTVSETLTNDKGRSLKISDSDKSIINNVREKLNSVKNFPTVRRVDDVIDYIQQELYKSNKNLALPANKEVNGFLKEVAGTLNKKLKEVAGTEYTSANQNFSSLKYLRDTLNEALGTDANKGASLMKQLFSPNGTMPKKLFADIQKTTGVDLVNEATLAKYAMEIAGDSRQQSLLAQVLEAPQSAMSKSGIINKAINYGVEKLQDPIGKAKKLIQGEEKPTVSKPTNPYTSKPKIVPKGIESTFMESGTANSPILKGIKEYLKNPKVGLSIEDVSGKVRIKDGKVYIPGQTAIPINKYLSQEIGAFPKSLRQGETIPKDEGFQPRPIP